MILFQMYGENIVESTPRPAHRPFKALFGLVSQDLERRISIRRVIENSPDKKAR